MNENPFSENPVGAGAVTPNYNPTPTPATTPTPSAAAADLRSAAGDFARTTSAQAANVKDRAIETASALKATASEKAEYYKGVASEKATHAKDSAQRQWDDSCVKAKEIHVSAEDYIRQNPTKAVLSALGVGFLIGLMSRN